MVVAKVIGFTPVETKVSKKTGEAYDGMTVFFTYSDPSVTGQMSGRCFSKVNKASSDPKLNYSIWVREGAIVLCDPDFTGNARNLMPADVLADVLTKP